MKTPMIWQLQVTPHIPDPVVILEPILMLMLMHPADPDDGDGALDIQCTRLDIPS
jgi:hypothetical protein